MWISVRTTDQSATHHGQFSPFFQFSYTHNYPFSSKVEVGKVSRDVGRGAMDGGTGGRGQRSYMVCTILTKQSDRVLKGDTHLSSTPSLSNPVGRKSYLFTQ